MGIAVIVKNTLLVLCLITLTTGCVKKETPDFGKNDEVNKAYTEDINGEMIFYDLKKPAIKAKVEVVESDHQNLSKAIFDDLKDKTKLLKEIHINEKNTSNHLTIKLNKVSEIGDGYLDQMTLEIPLILKSISSRFQNKKVSATFVQAFSDGSSLKLSYKRDDFSLISKEDLFRKTDIAPNDAKGESKKMLALICDSNKDDNSQYKFCNSGLGGEKNDKSEKNRSSKTIPDRDGIEKIIEENIETTSIKKDHGLSEDQKKTLQDAGFEITLNE